MMPVLLLPPLPAGEDAVAEGALLDAEATADVFEAAELPVDVGDKGVAVIDVNDRVYVDIIRTRAYL